MIDAEGWPGGVGIGEDDWNRGVSNLPYQDVCRQRR
jgi:hypothetical protein